MKTSRKIYCLTLAAATLLIGGCATVNEYEDEQEYSDMPWNSPQQWEGSRSIPGLSPGY